MQSTLGDHIEDLRTALIRILLVLAAGFLICLFFYPNLISWISPSISNAGLHLEKEDNIRVSNPHESTLNFVLPSGAELKSASEGVKKLDTRLYQIPPHKSLNYTLYISSKQLVILSPLEGIITAFKFCFYVAFIATAPAWGWIVAKFIYPGLLSNEKKIFVPFLLGSLFSVIIGIGVASFFTIPMANSYLSLFNSEIGLNLWSLEYYVNYTLMLTFGQGVAFELCFVLFFLVHMNWISADWLASKRRIMILLAFVLGALLTPPDVLTQFMLAIPLIIVYEITLIYARRKKGLCQRTSK